MGGINSRSYGDQLKFVDQAIINRQLLYKLSKQQMNEYPHFCIGALTARNRSHKLVKMTAAIVSPNLIITSAHSIFQKKQGPVYPQIGFENDRHLWSTYQNFKFYPAAFGQIDEQNGIAISSWRFPPQYSDIRCKDYTSLDYALMKLQTASTQTASARFLKPTAHCQACLLQLNKNKNLKICGYPYSQSRRQNYNPRNVQCTKYQIYQYGQMGKGRIHSIDNPKGTFRYLISTQPGQSGSPIMFGQHYIGLHNRGKF